MASQVSTLGTQPEDSRQLLAAGYEIKAEEKGAMQLVPSGSTDVASGTLGKVLRKGRLARLIMQHLGKNNHDETLAVEHEVVMTVGQPPHITAIPTPPKTFHANDLEDRDVDSLRDEMCQMHARIVQVEHENRVLREETAALKLSVARTSAREMTEDLTHTESETRSLALSDRQRLEQDIIHERKMREEEVKNLHKIFRAALIGNA